jgi:hypothetical protein
LGRYDGQKTSVGSLHVNCLARIADLYTPPSGIAAGACGHEHLPENSIENWEVVLWYKVLITYPCKYVMLLLKTAY